MTSTPFELLELPDGRWCVARIASAASTLIAGSFAPLESLANAATAAAPGPVGIFPSRDAAELAIQRAAPAHDVFSIWLRG
ncbi:hypothetical protein [Hyphomicrobium sp.]|uniref:hypothetical protein n=1 Tax=Hyphomicrobium sp. TaxID=82 RepID=UPI003F72DBD9